MKIIVKKIMEFKLCTIKHTANQTNEWHQIYDWDVLPHLLHYLTRAKYGPLYFGCLKIHLSGKWFHTDFAKMQVSVTWCEILLCTDKRIILAGGEVEKSAGQYNVFFVKKPSCSISRYAWTFRISLVLSNFSLNISKLFP